MDATQTEVMTAVLTTLGNSVATDTWAGFKNLLSKILGRGDEAESKREESELQRDHDKLVAAREEGDESRVARIDAKWSERLLDFLEEHPETIDSLRELAAKYKNDATGDPDALNVLQQNQSLDSSTIIAPASGNVNIGRWSTD